MNKLLGAGLARLKKSRAFWVSLGAMAALGVLLPLIRYIDMTRSGYTDVLDSCVFAYAVFIVIVAPAFCSLFLGTEYSDGTLRNKLIVGHGRAAIYLSALLVNAAAVALMQAAYLLAALALGLPLLGLQMGAAQFLLLVLCILLMSLAFTALFTLVGLLCQNKALTAVVCILGMFLLLFAGVYINSRLEEPETYSAYSYTDSSGTSFEDEMPNPNYLRGTKRAVYAALYDILPGGQTVQLAGGTAAHPLRLPLYSLLFIALSSAVGLCIFRKKDLK